MNQASDTRYPVWVPPHPTLCWRGSGRGTLLGEGRPSAAPKPYPVCHGIAEDHVLNFAAVFACTQSAGSHIHSHGECQAPPVPNHPVNARHVRWGKDTGGRPALYSMPSPNLGPAPPLRLKGTLHMAALPQWHVKVRVAPTASAWQLCPLNRHSGPQEHWKPHFASAAGIPRRG